MREFFHSLPQPVAPAPSSTISHRRTTSPPWPASRPHSRRYITFTSRHHLQSPLMHHTYPSSQTLTLIGSDLSPPLHFGLQNQGSAPRLPLHLTALRALPQNPEPSRDVHTQRGDGALQGSHEGIVKGSDHRHRPRLCHDGVLPPQPPQPLSFPFLPRPTPPPVPPHLFTASPLQPQR